MSLWMYPKYGTQSSRAPRNIKTQYWEISISMQVSCRLHNSGKLIYSIYYYVYYNYQYECQYYIVISLSLWICSCQKKI